MDYKNGKIYKIVSDLTDKIYIGSTTQPLYKRHSKHKGNYKQYIRVKTANACASWASTATYLLFQTSP